MDLGDIWLPWGRLTVLPLQTWEYSILALHVLVVFLLLMYAWPNFQSMTWRRFLLFLGLTAAALISNNLLVPRHPRPYLQAIPNVPAQPSAPFAPLLTDFPIVLAGALLGPGPALVIGLVQGIGRTFMTVSVILDPFYVAFFGFVVGVLLQQDFGGRLFGVLRQPIVAVPAAVLVLLPLNIVPVFTHVAPSGLTGLDYAVSVVRANAGPFLLKALLAGVFLQLTYFVAPALRAVHVPQIGSPFNRTLRRRLFWLLFPLIVLFSSVVIYVMGTNAIRLAKVRVVGEMARDANGIAEVVPDFVETGQDLLAVYAAAEDLRQTGLVDLREVLRSDLQTIVFFDQLLLLDSDAQLVTAYPPPNTGEMVLTADEQLLLERVLDTGASQISAVHPSPDDAPAIVFLAPTDYGTEGEGVHPGVLVGRTHTDVNPALRRIQDELRWTYERG